MPKRTEKESRHALDCVDDVVNMAIGLRLYRATKFIAPHLVVRATVVGAKKKKLRKGSDVDIRLTIGRPNYAERKMIKDLKKSGVAFPVSNIYFTFPRDHKVKVAKA